MSRKPTVPLEKYFDSEIKNVKKAVTTAYTSMDKRLDGMNEIRDQLKTQASTFINRDTFEALQRQVSALEIDKAKLQGKADQSTVNRNGIIAIVGVILSVFGILLKYL